MKKMKKALSLLLAAMMLVSCMSITAFAEWSVDDVSVEYTLTLYKYDFSNHTVTSEKINPATDKIEKDAYFVVEFGIKNNTEEDVCVNAWDAFIQFDRTLFTEFRDNGTGTNRNQPFYSNVYRAILAGGSASVRNKDETYYMVSTGSSSEGEFISPDDTLPVAQFLFKANDGIEKTGTKFTYISNLADASPAPTTVTLYPLDDNGDPITNGDTYSLGTEGTQFTASTVTIQVDGSNPKIGELSLDTFTDVDNATAKAYVPATGVKVNGTAGATVNAKLVSTSGTNLTEAGGLTWEVTSTPTGAKTGADYDVTVDDGVITVPAKAKDGDYTIKVTTDGTDVEKAGDNGEIDSKEVTLKVARADAKAKTLTIKEGNSEASADSIISKPLAGTSSKTFALVVEDQYGDVMTQSAADASLTATVGESSSFAPAPTAQAGVAGESTLTITLTIGEGATVNDASTVTATAANTADDNNLTKSITVTVKDIDADWEKDLGADAKTITYGASNRSAVPLPANGAKGTATLGSGDSAKVYNGTYSYVTDEVALPDAGTETVRVKFVIADEEQDARQNTKLTGTEYYHNFTVTVKQKTPTFTWSGYENLTYNGRDQGPTLDVTDLVSGQTADIQYADDNNQKTAAATYTATATVKIMSGTVDVTKNYDITGLTTQQFTIAPKNVGANGFTVTLDPTTAAYTGSTQTPAITVKDGDAEVAATDYTPSWDPATIQNAGTYTLTVTGQNNYASSSTGTVTYTVTKANQTTALTINGAAAPEDQQTKDYGDPTFEIRVAGGDGTGAYTLTSSNTSVLSADKASAEDGVFTITVGDLGLATLTITRAGDTNYEDSTAEINVVLDYRVNAKTITSDMIGDIEDQTYDGTAKKPDVTITSGADTLVKNTDYTLAYTDNTDVSENATVTVTGVGNYTGTATKTFKIKPMPVAQDDVTITVKKYDVGSSTAMGQPITIPNDGIIVTLGNKTLVAGTDFTVTAEVSDAETTTINGNSVTNPTKGLAKITFNSPYENKDGAEISQEFELFKLGDTDGNRMIQAADSLEILRHIAGYTTLTGTKLLAADTDNNKLIQANDSLNVLRHIAGYIDLWSAAWNS